MAKAPYVLGFKDGAEVQAILQKAKELPAKEEIVTITDLLNYYSKTETDEQIAAKIAEIVANAPASFDTLKEIADWITNHAESASAMNSAIQANTAAIDTKVDKVAGKGLSTEDFTTALKNKLNGLSNYNDTTLKSDISSIKSTLGYVQKNIVELIQPETLQSVNGIDFVFNADGKFTATGTATADTYIKVTENVSDYKSTGLILTGCPAGGSFPPSGYSLLVANANQHQENFANDFGFGSTFSLPPHIEEWAVWCHIGAGVTVNNLEFAPMVRLESIQDGTFETHKPNVDERLLRIESAVTNAVTLNRGTAIPSNSNLDDYTDIGIYYSAQAAVSQTLMNTPYITGGFRLEVISIAASNSFLQKLFPNSQMVGGFFMRTHTSQGFGPWFKYQGEEVPVVQ